MSKPETAIAIVQDPHTPADLVTAAEYQQPTHTKESLTEADRKAYTKARTDAYKAGNRAWARWGRTPSALELRAEVLCGASASNDEVRTRIKELRASDAKG